jgi:DNA-binding CsgD family transcriptional regulator
MQDQSLAHLTDSQRACLLLVLEGARSKEIAPLLGLTFRTVDQYLHEAQQDLGASARREAARAFAAAIDEAELKRLQLKFPALAGVAMPRQIPSSSEMQKRRRSAWPRLMTILRPPPIGGERHDLTLAGKLLGMSRAVLYMAAFMSGLVLLLAGILTLLN